MGVVLSSVLELDSLSLFVCYVHIETESREAKRKSINKPPFSKQYLKQLVTEYFNTTFFFVLGT